MALSHWAPGGLVSRSFVPVKSLVLLISPPGPDFSPAQPPCCLGLPKSQHWPPVPTEEEKRVLVSILVGQSTRSQRAFCRHEAMQDRPMQGSRYVLSWQRGEHVAMWLTGPFLRKPHSNFITSQAGRELSCTSTHS